jgi:hypothetical protein
MLRRNFLRNAAFTLPVALIAPEALLASSQNSPQEAGIILVGTDAATHQVAELLAANGQKATALVQKQVAKVVCTQAGFLLTDGQGNTYSSRKVIFSGGASFCDTSANVHVQANGSPKITLSIKRNGKNSATCWTAPVGGADAFLLSSFTNSKKVAFMCLP